MARLAIGGLAGALLTVLGFAPSAMAAPVSHFRVNANVSLTEGDAGVTNMTFTISYTGTKNNVSVDWATANGTATAGADYAASSGTATFTAAGATSQTITIPVIGDLLDEANETFTVNLSNPQPPAIADITTATRTGTITDNDPTPSLTINDLSLTEGNAGNVERRSHRHAVGTERSQRDGPLRHRQQHGRAAGRLRDDLGEPHVPPRTGDASRAGSR